MIIQYHCRGCCKKDEWRDVIVPERIGNTDLGAWMEVVRHCVTYHHSFTVAICRLQACDLKIPVPDDIETNPNAMVGHDRDKAKQS